MRIRGRRLTRIALPTLRVGLVLQLAPPQLMASIADRLKRKREKEQEDEEEGEEFVKEKTMRMEPLPSPFMLVKIFNY